MTRSMVLIVLGMLQLGCAAQTYRKINGVSFVASREKVAQEHVQEVVRLNATHAAVMPFGFMRETNKPILVFNSDRQWFGETRDGITQYVGMLHQNGIEVMMKPQIWIRGGEFTGKLTMQSEEDWKRLESDYTDFIMTYASAAAELKIGLFCIGTELESFVKNRPEFWKELIRKVRSVFPGKLTYAANWDEYGRTPFWEDLDYIGIDAYFPLSGEQTPSVAALKSGWQQHKTQIASLAELKDKPILFTEYGYRSSDYAAKRPWEEGEDEKVNLTAQANATRAILEEFWKEDWFAGGFIWKWFLLHKESGGDQDARFTPQNKPAQMVIRDFYKQN